MAPTVSSVLYSQLDFVLFIAACCPWAWGAFGGANVISRMRPGWAQQRGDTAAQFRHRPAGNGTRWLCSSIGRGLATPRAPTARPGCTQRAMEGHRPTMYIIMGVSGCGKRCGVQHGLGKPALALLETRPRRRLRCASQHRGQAAGRPPQLSLLRCRRLPPSMQRAEDASRAGPERRGPAALAACAECLAG